MDELCERIKVSSRKGFCDNEPEGMEVTQLKVVEWHKLLRSD
jgi:hypothetical protein